MDPLTLILGIALIGLLALLGRPLMAYDPNEQVAEAQSWPTRKRALSTETKPKTIAAGTGTLAPLTPMAFNTSTGFWQVWSATDGADAKETITVDATSGNWTISVAFGGAAAETTANIAFNATAATVEQRLEALANILPGDVTVTGGVGASGGGTPYVITFGGNLAKTPVTVTVADVDLAGGGDTVTVVHTTVGAANVGKSEIRSFIWPDPVTLVADKEVLGQMLLAGDVHYDDIVLPSGEVEANLKAALRVGPRSLGIKIQGLDGVR